MRASELLASVVVDEAGRSLGPVRDVRVDPRSRRIAGLVVDDGPLAAPAHAWGYAEGRAKGPAALRALLVGASSRARYVPAARVEDWGPGRVRIRGDRSGLPSLAEELAR
jgi:sporulation protein YlmC with PRC-barrel domain